MSEQGKRPTIARIWRGRTQREVADLSRSEMQVLLRRAALRVENKTQEAGKTVLDRDVLEVIELWAAASSLSRDDAVNTALRDWATGFGLLETEAEEE